MNTENDMNNTRSNGTAEAEKNTGSIPQGAVPAFQQPAGETVCPKCGNTNPPNSKFCRYCGSPMGAAVSYPQAGYPDPYQQQNTMGAYPYPPQNMGGYPPYPQGYPTGYQQGYQPQPFPAYNGAPNPMGGYPYQPQNPVTADPRLKQFQTSTLQPGQREIVRCMQVSKTYGTVNALNSVNLVIGSGRVVGLLGPNGSGKTTLIKLICGLLTPTSGSITVNGTPIGAATKAMVSYLPDRTYIQDWMKIRNILDFFSDFYQDFRRPLAEAMLNNLHISPESVMKTLSKGTQEKVQLVLVMSRNASLYLLDEPIAGVDPVARDYILDTIIRAHNPDSSVVISTHLITDIEPVLNEVIMIKYGSLALHGDANQLRSTFGKSLNDIFKEVFAGC